MAALKRMIQIGIDSRPATTGGREVENSLERVKKKTKQTRDELGRYQRQQEKTTGGARGLARGLAALAGGFTAVLAIRSTLKVIADFEEVMTTVAQVTGATELEFAALSQTARELGATTRFSATEAGDGLLFLARAGFTVREAITAVPATLNLAAAGAIGLGEAADYASNILSAFQLEAAETERVVDTLVQTSNRSNTDVRQLAEAMKFAAPVAGALGISIEETAAAIGVLGDSGIQASLAGTNLRGILAGLLKPTTEGAKAITEMGLSLDKLDPSTNSIIDIFGRFRATGLSAADAVAIFGRRNAAAALVLANGTEKIIQLNDENRKAAGTAQEFAEALAKTTQGKFKAFISAVQELQLQIGDKLTPAIKSFLDTLTGAARTLGGVVVVGEEASTAAKLLATTIKLAALALTAFVAVKAIRFLGLLASGFAKAALAEASLTSQTTILAAALTGLLAFELGKTLYGEFKIVQQGAAYLINFIQTGWEIIKADTKILGAFIKSAFLEAIQFAANNFADLVDAIGRGVRDLENLTGLDLGGKGVRDLSQKIRLDLDFDLGKAVNAINEQADSNIKFADEVLAQTLEDIRKEFEEKGGESGRSFIDAYVANLTGDVDSIMSALLPKAAETQDALAALAEDTDLGLDPELMAKLAMYEAELEAMEGQLGAVGDEAEKAAESLAKIGEELDFQLATIGMAKDDVALYALELEAAALASTVFGAGTEEAARAVEGLVEKLKAVQAAQAAFAEQKAMEDAQEDVAAMNDEVREEIKLLGMSRDARQRYTRETEFAAKAAEAFGKDQEALTAAIEEYAGLLDELDIAEQWSNIAEEVGQAFAQTFEDIVFGAESVEDAIESLVKNTAKIIFQELVTKQIASFIGGFFGPGLFGGGAAMGGVVKQGSFTAFASGGIVDKPTLFPMSGGRTGLVGEGLMPEAIVPLPDGRSIPVKMDGGGGGQTVVVKMTVNTPNAESFRESEPQIVGSLARRLRRRAT